MDRSPPRGGEASDSDAMRLEARKSEHFRAQLALGKEQAVAVNRDMEDMWTAIRRLQSALGPSASAAGGGSLADRQAKLEREFVSKYGLLLERAAEAEKGATASEARLRGALADLESMGDRVGFLERELGQSNSMHGRMLEELLPTTAARRTIAERVAFLEQSTGGFVAKYDTVLEELRSVGEFGRSHARHVSACQERLQYIERDMGTSFDKHIRALDDLRSAQEGQGRRVAERHATMDEHLACLERQVADSADRAADALADLRARHEELRASNDQHSSIPERVARLEGKLGGGAPERASQGSLPERLDALEQHLDVSAAVRAADAKRLEERLSRCEGLVRHELSESALRADLTAAAFQQYASRRKDLETDLQRFESPVHTLPPTPPSDRGGPGGGCQAASPPAPAPAPASADPAWPGARAGRPGPPPEGEARRLQSSRSCPSTGSCWSARWRREDSGQPPAGRPLGQGAQALSASWSHDNGSPGAAIGDRFGSPKAPVGSRASPLSQQLRELEERIEGHSQARQRLESEAARREGQLSMWRRRELPM